jgi:chromate transporter
MEYPKLPLAAIAPWPLLAAFAAWHPDSLRDLALVFLRAGGLLFGGGYVLIPLIQDSVTKQHAWLSQQQFLDGVALGQATPGPIVITATFVGYAAAGLPGALVATVAVFAPSCIFAIAPSNLLQRVQSWNAHGVPGGEVCVVGTIAEVRARRSAINDG